MSHTNRADPSAPLIGKPTWAVVLEVPEAGPVHTTGRSSSAPARGAEPTMHPMCAPAGPLITRPKHPRWTNRTGRWTYTHAPARVPGPVIAAVASVPTTSPISPGHWSTVPATVYSDRTSPQPTGCASSSTVHSHCMWQAYRNSAAHATAPRCGAHIHAGQSASRSRSFHPSSRHRAQALQTSRTPEPEAGPPDEGPRPLARSHRIAPCVPPCTDYSGAQEHKLSLCGRLAGGAGRVSIPELSTSRLFARNTITPNGRLQRHGVIPVSSAAKMRPA